MKTDIEIARNTPLRPIGEIAAQVGITDTSYFSRFFKKHCKVTPSEYRKAFR